jgi:TonB-dependent Receptor Plug Domain.
VLRNVPGVSVSPDGNVKIKNSDRYIVFVDGKPTNLSLKDIPASQIEYIEVITNPSAEFDAEGNAIINVILKKQKDYGYSVNVNVNMDSYGTISPNIFYGLKMGNLSTYIRLKGGKTISKSYFEGQKIFQKDTISERC